MDKVAPPNQIDRLLRPSSPMAVFASNTALSSTRLPEHRDWKSLKFSSISPAPIPRSCSTAAESCCAPSNFWRSRCCALLPASTRSLLRLPESPLHAPGRAAGRGRLAAEKVRKTKMPYQFCPMSSRERRIVHLALRDQSELNTQSEGEGANRCLVVYPKDYKGGAGKLAPRNLP